MQSIKKQKFKQEFETFFLSLSCDIYSAMKSLLKIIYSSHNIYFANKAYFYCAMAIPTRLVDYKINYFRTSLSKFISAKKYLLKIFRKALGMDLVSVLALN